MITRDEFISSLVGMPWVANAKGPDAWDCYHLVRHVVMRLRGIEMPLFEIPNDPQPSWIIKTVQDSDKLGWTEVNNAILPDISIVLMARVKHPSHMGVWLAPERRILHVDIPHNVVLQDIPTAQILWRRLYFYDKL